MNSTSHAGAAAELFACQYFLGQGLEVFRNVAASGPVDLFIFNKNNCKAVPVDIKSLRTPYYRVDGTLSIGQKATFRDDGVWQLVYIHGEDSLRVPEGFWLALGME